MVRPSWMEGRRSATMAIGALAWIAGAGCSVGSADLSPCDIRRESCREDVSLALADVRDTGWDPWQRLPPTRVITPAEFEAIVTESASSVNPTLEYRAWERSMQLLSLIPRQTSFADANVQNSTAVVAAYYSSKDKSITVIDRGTPVDERDDVQVLAHELTHAAQDRDVGLDGYMNAAQSYDDSLARLSVVEGEAVLYSNLVILPTLGVDPDHASWSSYHSSWIAAERTRVAASDVPYFAVRSLVYPLGSERMTALWRSGGSAATRAFWRGSPGPTRDLFFDVSQPAPVAPTCRAPVAPAGLAVTEPAFAFGAVMLYAFATRWTEEPTAWALATGWIGDRMTVFASSDASRVGLVWVARVADSGLAQGLAGDIAAAADSELAATAAGAEVVIVAATDAQTLTSLTPKCP